MRRRTALGAAHVFRPAQADLKVGLYMHTNERWLPPSGDTSLRRDKDCHDRDRAYRRHVVPLELRTLSITDTCRSVRYDAVMRALLKFLVVVAVLAALVGGGAWIWAGRAEGPQIEIRQPEKFVGQATPLELVVESPDGQFSRVDVTLEQAGKSFPVFSLDQPAQGSVKQEAAERLYISRQIGKRAMPELQAGPARIVVRAARPVLYGIREAESEATRDVDVRLEPPRVAVLSTFHYVNHGGAEFVVYRATPADVESGVRVGDKTYPGFPASGAGIKADPAHPRGVLRPAARTRT